MSPQGAPSTHSPPVGDTHTPLGAGAVSSMTVTGSDWEERLHVPGARMLRAAGDHDTLCRAVTSRASIGLSIQALSVLRVGGCTELPSSGCSARGEDVGRWHLLILGSKSHHGDGSRCHRVVPPRTPATGRAASPASRGLSAAFRKAQRPKANTSHEWEDITGLSTLTFSSSSSNKTRLRQPPAMGALRERNGGR